MKRALSAACLALGAACSTPPLADLSGLAVGEPLSYSVMLTGGAFLRSEQAAAEKGFEHTYGSGADASGADLGEVIPLASIKDVLARGRVFVKVALDTRPPTERRRLVGLRPSPSLGDLPLREFLAKARREGYDLLLVVEEFGDGPVERRGVNGQWPITAAVWFLIGLGMVIPDHTYESRASMRVTLRDVHTGKTVDSPVFSAGPVDLSLVTRTDVLGLFESIVVPPFWVGDEPENVVAAVRRFTTAQLLLRMARRMKSVDLETRLERVMPAAVHVRREGRGWRIEVTTEGSLSVLRMRVDGVPIEAARTEAFARRLHASVQVKGTSRRYQAVFGERLRGRTLQVLVQTVAGGVASVTVPLAGG